MNIERHPGRRIFSVTSAVIITTLLFSASSAFGQDATDDNSSGVESEADMLFMLLLIQADLQGSLSDLDMDVANAAQNVSTTGLDGTAAREVLRKLLEKNLNLAQVATFGKDGRIVIAEGKESKSAEGADISSQEHIARVLKTKTPTLSKQFLLAEGYNGTALEYPVFSPEGEFIGGVSAIIEPDKLMDSLIAAQLNSNISTRGNITGISFWLMDLEGLLLYDEDPSQIGRNLIEDPLYKPYLSLLELEHKIVAERFGHGYYSFFEPTAVNKTEVHKECYWTTVGLHGNEWRLVVTKAL